MASLASNFKMNRLLIVCYILCMGIIAIYSQDETSSAALSEDICGERACTALECCVTIYTRQECRPLQKKGDFCNMPLLCGCEPGLVCIPGPFGFNSRCGVQYSTTPQTA